MTGQRRGAARGRVNFVEIHRRYPAAGPWNVDIVRLLEQAEVVTEGGDHRR